MKGWDLQQYSVAASTAKRPKSKHIYDIHSKGHKGDREHQIRHRIAEHKRLHIKQRDQWASGADLGRPSATQAAGGVVIRITCAQPSNFSRLPKGIKERTITINTL